MEIFYPQNNESCKLVEEYLVHALKSMQINPKSNNADKYKVTTLKI